MRAPGRFALLTVAAMLVAACSDGTVSEAPSPPDAAAANAAEAPPTTPPSAADRPPVLRSLQLSSSGWRFDLDAAAGEATTRVDVLVRTATVGAAPQRLSTVLDGALVDAFATDLDGDAAPELLLWMRSGGSSAEGDLRGWRFDTAGGNTPLQVPSLDDEAALGWRGRDQFGVQASTLVRSFPIYRDQDDNASPSAGFVRVIRYRLEAEGLVAADTTLEPMDGTPQAEVLAR